MGKTEGKVYGEWDYEGRNKWGETLEECGVRLRREGRYDHFYNAFLGRRKEDREKDKNEIYLELVNEHFKPLDWVEMEPAREAEEGGGKGSGKEKEKAGVGEGEKKRKQGLRDARLEDFKERNKGRNAALTIEWVSYHIHVRNVKPEMAPSSQAWNLLKWVRKDDKNETDFWKTIWKPPKSVMDESGKNNDDGRDLLELIDRVQAARKNALLRAGAQGAGSEPVVPARNDITWFQKPGSGA
jgi:hypothetical protein